MSSIYGRLPGQACSCRRGSWCDGGCMMVSTTHRPDPSKFRARPSEISHFKKGDEAKLESGETVIVSLVAREHGWGDYHREIMYWDERSNSYVYRDGFLKRAF